MALQAHRISLSQRKWSEHQSQIFANSIFESKGTYGFRATLLFHVVWLSTCCMPCFIFSPIRGKGSHKERDKSDILFWNTWTWPYNICCGNFLDVTVSRKLQTVGKIKWKYIILPGLENQFIILTITSTLPSLHFGVCILKAMHQF